MTSNRRRLAALLLVTGLAVSPLAACSSGDSSTAADAPGPSGTPSSAGSSSVGSSSAGSSSVGSSPTPSASVAPAGGTVTPADASATASGSPSSAAASATPSATSSGTAAAAALPQLPRGGRAIFPRYRVVAYYGAALSSRMGVLGEGTPDQAARRLARAAGEFVRPGHKPVLPAFELIVTIAHRTPERGGKYSTTTSDAEIARFVAAARRLKALVVLDVQPGRAEFLPEVKIYEKWLRQPDIGLALDPEWKMGPGQIPGRRIGHTDARTINAVSAWLDQLVVRHRLPQKLFLVHQFRETMVLHRPQVVARPHLATVFHIDGFGGQQIKRQVYRRLFVRPPFHNGFKLFYDEDTNRLTPAETMGLRPVPDLVTFQ